MGNPLADLAHIVRRSTQMFLRPYAKPTGRVRISVLIAALSIY